jgi:acyl carrier protein
MAQQPLTEVPMTEPELYTELNTVFQRVLDDDTIALTASTTAEDVEGWDSMNHIFIVVELEKHFCVKFHAAEMEEVKNIGELVTLLTKKML